jgi:rifampicin phosphotransferase
MTMVLRLADIDASMIDAVGGKAVNLGILIAAGLPVPTGFCVTTHAYRDAVADRLDKLIDQLAEPSNADSLSRLADQARSTVLAAPVSDELRQTIVEHYRALGEEAPVAVRSSATAEDLAYASFAGQQDTYLNVVGAEAVVDAVQRCWASLWTDRAVSYRNTHRIDHRTVSLAVVVENMIDAVAAGVMFTANPVTGTRRQTVIDASAGLGEAVVSGAVNPDHFVVDTTSHTIVQRQVGDKRMVVLSRPGGGTDAHHRDERSNEPCLTDGQVLELVDLGRRVTEHYGAPQDTEWALDGMGRFWLTQARPITTLYPVPTQNADPARIYMCLTLAQGLTRPITPMGLAAFRLIGSSVAAALGRPPIDRRAGPPPMSIVAQRLYADITPVISDRLARRLIIGAFGAMEARAATALKTLANDPRFPIRSRWPRAAVPPVARVVLLRAKVPLRLTVAMINPAIVPALITRAERRLRTATSVPPNASATERLDHVERQLGNDLFITMPTIFSYAAAGLLVLRLARRLLGELAGPGDLQTVLRSLPNNVTTEMDLQLWELTELIRNDHSSAEAFAEQTTAALTARYRNRTLPPVAQQGLTAFLRRYGHRAVAEIDIGMPRWADDPSHIIGVIANYLRLNDPDLAPAAQFRQGEATAQAMITELVSRASQRGVLKARLINFGLRRARQLVGFRESPKYLLIVVLGALREQLSMIGEELAKRGQIETPDDVFFLDASDVRRALGGEVLRDLVAKRHEAYEIELRRRHIPRLLLSDGTEVESLGGVAHAGDGKMSGSPASPGMVTGPARVVLDPVGAHLEPGEILVAPSTDPGWTPLFLTAGGLVMEMGGSNSHGAVVAREYGIPAVVGVPEATNLIETGQLVTVDGAAGVVSLAAAPA